MKSVKIYNGKDLKGSKNVYFEPKFIRYMGFSSMTDKDLSFIVVTYNLYHYVKNKKVSLLQKDTANLERGCDTFAVSVSHKDMQEIQENHGVNEKLASKIREFLSNVKDVSIKGYTLHGVNNKPKVSDKDLAAAWERYLKKNVYANLEDEIIKNFSMMVGMGNDDFQIKLVILRKNLEFKNNSFFVSYYMDCHDAKHGNLLATAPVDINTKFTFKQDGSLELMEKVLDKVEEDYFKNKKEYDNPKIHSIGFKKSESSMNIISDMDQTVFVLDRVKVILEKHNGLVGSVKFDKHLRALQVELKCSDWSISNPALIFGGNGFATNMCSYARNGSDDASDRKKALSMFNNLVGKHPIWKELLDCYDFRKNIEKEV